MTLDGILTVVRFSHHIKTSSSIVVTPSGMFTVFRLSQKSGAWCFHDNEKMKYEGIVPDKYNSVVDMGVRPNDIVFDENSGLRGTVRRSIFLGSEYNMFVDFDGQEVRVQRSTFDDGAGFIKEGSEVGINFLNPVFYSAKEA